MCLLCLAGAEQCSQCIFLNVRTNDAESAGGGSTACPNVRCTRYIVKVNPLAICSGNNALCTQNHTILFCIFELFQCRLNFFCGIRLCRFYAPAGEYFICMVMMVMFVIVVMVVTIASAGFAVFMVVVMVVMMLVFMIMIVVVVMMMAATGFIMVVVIMVMMVMFVFMLGFFEQVLQSRIQCFRLIHVPVTI